MFCRNCGNQIDPNAAVCIKCGYQNGAGQNFCPNCGGQVYWQRDEGSVVDVCAMTLDDFSNFRGKE
jgi:hypothetical protein